jgi:hypothetical protein
LRRNLFRYQILERLIASFIIIRQIEGMSRALLKFEKRALLFKSYAASAI